MMSCPTLRSRCEILLTGADLRGRDVFHRSDFRVVRPSQTGQSFNIPLTPFPGTTSSDSGRGIALPQKQKNIVNLSVA